jgi:hypothetical protein
MRTPTGRGNKKRPPILRGFLNRAMVEITNAGHRYGVVVNYYTIS